MEMTKNDFQEQKRKKYLERMIIFTNYFENNFSILGNGKHQKVLEKVMESHGIL